jgi:hypothetical protein
MSFEQFNQEEGGDGDVESPTYVLSETLQALEIEGMSPDFYVAVDRSDGILVSRW